MYICKYFAVYFRMYFIFNLKRARYDLFNKNLSINIRDIQP